MTRQLPWKRLGASAVSTPLKESSPQRPRTPASAPPPRVLRTPLPARHQRVLDSDPLRSPSTSPPPEPPKQQFMIPGPLEDDQYRMVEDEFLHVAQKFTTHLHRAEYERLKALAKSQNADTIREIERPVVATASHTHIARIRRDAARRVTKQRKALRDTGGDDGGELPLGNSLRSLMESPRKESRYISTSVGGTSTTRAAAGFQRHRTVQPERLSETRRISSRNDSSETEDQMPSSPPVRRLDPRALDVTTPQPPRQPGNSTSHRSGNSSNHRSSNSNFGEPSPNHGRQQSRRNAGMHDAKEDDDDLFGMRQRRVNRQKSKEQMRRPDAAGAPTDKTRDTMPSFL